MYVAIIPLLRFLVTGTYYSAGHNRCFIKAAACFRGEFQVRPSLCVCVFGRVFGRVLVP